MTTPTPHERTVHGHLQSSKSLELSARNSGPRQKLLSYWEIGLFAAICTADMLSTLYWYLHGRATESNPLLAYWLRKSVLAFCIAKLTSFVPLLAICVVFRNRYPKLIVSGLRFAMIAYVAIYLVSIGIQLWRH